MGITAKTLYVWKNEYSDICEALKKGKEVVDYQVENALLNKALGGDTTAQIFWLKNRRPDKWRDKPETVGEKKPGDGAVESMTLADKMAAIREAARTIDH